jgi:phage terminase large subunit-like protein
LVEIAAAFFGTPHTWVHVIADAIGIDVSSAIATAYPDGVKLVAGAVAVPLGDVNAAALVDVTWSVADATSIKRAHAVVHVIADAIGIRVLGAIATTDAQGVNLVAIAVAVTFWDRSATAGKYSSWAIANVTGVKRSYTVVHVITDAIGIRVLSAIATTNAQGVKLVPIAIAVTSGDVSASTLEDFTRAVANVTSVKRSYTVVHIITDAIGICIGCTVTATVA